MIIILKKLLHDKYDGTKNIFKEIKEEKETYVYEKCKKSTYIFF